MPEMRRCWEVPAAGHRTGLSRRWEGRGKGSWRGDSGELYGVRRLRLHPMSEVFESRFKMKSQVDRISPDYSGNIGTWAHAKIALRHCPVFLTRRILQRVLPGRNSS
jgi:hypothetical protein